MERLRERRQHKRFITRNTEYHLRETQCVGVRCRRSGAWIEDHLALGQRLSGGLSRTPHGYAPAPPGPGASLWFDAGGLDIITSTVETEARPEREAVWHYV